MSGGIVSGKNSPRSGEGGGSSGQDSVFASREQASPAAPAGRPDRPARSSRAGAESPDRSALERLIALAVAREPMSPEEIRAQRISFVYGQMMDCAPHVTRDEVAAMHDAHYGIERRAP